MYTKTVCPFCVNAKNLLKSKGIIPEEISIQNDIKLMEEMIQKAGGKRTVPQIFIEGEHIGGFQELNHLDKMGLLDAKIA